jgi:hypothetical protein
MAATADGAGGRAAATGITPVGSYTGKAQRTRDVRREERTTAAVEAGADPSGEQRSKTQLAEKAAEKLLGADMFQEYKRQLDRVEGTEKDVIIRMLIGLGKLSMYHLQEAFHIGRQRVARVMATDPALRLQTVRKSDEVIRVCQQYIREQPAEQGYACTHRQQREYLLEGHFRSLWQKYKKLEEDAGRKFFGYDRFYVILTTVRPLLRSSRLREDECDACVRISNLLKYDTSLTPERRAELEAEKLQHFSESKVQREAYNDLIKTFSKQWDDPAPVQDPLIIDLPEHATALRQRGGDDQQRRGVVWSEDYGESLADPVWADRRPSSDHWTSNLLLYMYVSADTSRGTNYVYCYDERSAGKGADAVASLRWLHLANYFEDLRARGLDFPTELIFVRDNCSGQNKSNETAKFLMLVSLIFQVRIRVLFLKPGHSHMWADRVVALAKSMLRGHNFFTAKNIVKQMGQARTVKAVLVERFFDWGNLVNKHFPKELPAGFTQESYYWVISPTSIKFFRLFNSPEPWRTHEFASDLTMKILRAAVIRDLTGCSGDDSLHRIVTSELCVPKTARRELTAEKAASIWSNVKDKVPKAVLSCYPQPHEKQPARAAASQQQPNTQPATGGVFKPALDVNKGNGKARPGPRPQPQPLPGGQTSLFSFCSTRTRSPSPTLLDRTRAIKRRRRARREAAELAHAQPPQPARPVQPERAGTSRCKGCGEEVEGSHFCDLCGAPMHVFCGVGVGEEGFGQKIRCPQCQ